MSENKEELYWEDYFLKQEWMEAFGKGHTNMDFETWKSINAFYKNHPESINIISLEKEDENGN